MVIPLLIAAVAAAAAGPAADPNVGGALADLAKSERAEACRNDQKADILICGRRGERYRIDPSVLEASRAHDSAPAKPRVPPDASPDNSCVGPQHCGDAVIPLVAVALTAIRAAELAANGEDWRDSLRTHEDEYRLYKQAEERKVKQRRVIIGVAAGSK